MEGFEVCSIPAIAAICYGFIELLKRTSNYSDKLKNAYPLISAIFGAIVGVVAYLAEPSFAVVHSVLGAALCGMASGLSATGSNEILQRLKQKTKTALPNPTDDPPPKYYITGDKHRHFKKLIEFCKTNNLRRKDVIVILGDAGFNYYGDKRDEKLKKQLSEVNVTLFCIYGNKEKRPETIATYGIQTFCGGIAYYEPGYPNLLFAKDGEVYDFNGKQFMTIGGAHSVDKLRCLEEGLPFFEDEMPSAELRSEIERTLEARGNKIDGFLTHTCPLSFIPTETFVSTRRAASESKGNKKNKTDTYPLDIDRSTEEWLEGLKEKVSFEEWYCGHYHVDKVLGSIRMLHHEFLPFCANTGNDV